jgi:tetratricopeptide (TPR) repeat protein
MAIAEFSEAIRLNPSNVEYFSMRAMCYAMVGKLDLALEDCERGMKVSPGNSQLAYVRGLANLYGDRLGQAITDYRNCIAKDERNQFGHLGIAFVLAGAEDASLRNGELAVLHATRGCELTEWADAHALATLANAYAESGDFSLAIETISKALDLADSDDRIVMLQYLELFESQQPVRWYAKHRFAGISAESNRS